MSTIDRLWKRMLGRTIAENSSPISRSKTAALDPIVLKNSKTTIGG
jgi:hypothetical protein